MKSTALLRPATTAVALLQILVASGCYASYTGIYFVRRSHDHFSSTLGELGEVVGAAVRPFGLCSGGKVVGSDSIVFFGTREADIAPQYAHLKGAGASISVSVSVASWPDRFKPFYITIRDLSNHNETDFVRALKGEIEERIARRYKIKMDFERQSDMFL